MRRSIGFGRWWSPKTNTTHLLHTQTKPLPINSHLKELVQTGHFIKALERYIILYNTAEFKPDNFTFPYILKSSTHLNQPTIGLLIHNTAIKTGFEYNLFVANSLILFYARFGGHIHSILYLFDQMPQRNIVTWTALISALSQNHQSNSAIGYFRDMLVTGVKPNSFTMATILPCFCFGKGPFQIHTLLIKRGFEYDVLVSTALIQVYAKCESVFAARQVFNEMPEKNVVSWNTMILVYNQNGHTQVSLRLFVEMLSLSEIKPDTFSVVEALNSCTTGVMELRMGKSIHCFAYKIGVEGSIFVGNALVNLYGKCGLLQLAEQIFHEMQERDVSSWTTLITCYGLYGHGLKAVSIFEEMTQTTTVEPNSVTLTAVLTACSHSCLVQEGLGYFESMTPDFGIKPTIKHYACVVDLLGRAGFLEEALEFIYKMPIQADVQLWETLLGAATIQGNKAVTEIAAKILLELKCDNPEVHVQLANMYANCGLWERVAKIRSIVQCRNLRKKPGISYLTKF